jgi:nicotinamide-nucleotide amidase
MSHSEHTSADVSLQSHALHELSDMLVAMSFHLCTAESCTGGLIAATCTSISGSSRWFDRAFVTYSNNAKSEMLGIPTDFIASYGAVSEPVVRAMALQSSLRASTECSIAVSGIAGPGGGHTDKPVGTVWFAWCVKGTVFSKRCQFSGSREEIRRACVTESLRVLVMKLQEFRTNATVEL